jgi:Pentapeptide repeats (8 copies)
MAEIETAPVNLSQARRRHGVLMRESIRAGNLTSMIETVEAFMREVADLGAGLKVEDDRASAQNILDYWAASLAGAGDSRRARESVKLRPFEAKSLPPNADASLPNAPDRNPFRDIGHVSRTDGERLPGREDAIRSVLNLLDQYGIVFVIGPAGSGRSALVNAGVLWQLENATEPRAIFSLLTPGNDPLASLARITRQADARRIARTPARFRADFEAVRGPRPGVLSIDNAEELFTRCSDQSARESFAAAVSSLCTRGDGPRNGVIVILRDEWDEQIFALKGFASVPREARFRPAPPTAAELQRMIRIPAAAAGVTFESGIVEDLARELQGDMAALPLVQFMLMRLWSLSKGGQIDWEVYQRAGRPQDALGRVAKDTYNSLSASGKKAAQRLFLTLAGPRAGDSDQGLVARSHRESRRVLTDDGHDIAMVEAIDAFERAGLLRASTYGETTDDNLEIIHDGLLHRWNEAVEWLVDEKRRFQETLEILNSAALWQRSGQPDGLLLANWDVVNRAADFRSRQPFSVLSETEQGLLSQYVEASKNYLERQDRRKRRKSVARNILLSLLLLLTVLVALLYSDIWAPNWFTANNPLNLLALRDRAIIAIKITNPKKPDHRLMFRALSVFQTLTSMEINLSPARIYDQNLSKITLYAPNFDDADFQDTNLNGAVMPNATFHGSSFEGTDFSEAKLRFAQFQRAIFEGPTSFRLADLYGVAFDRAQLCEVDFSGAGLGNATFWNASFPTKKEKFLANFRNSPWWLASGWTKLQLHWLHDVPFEPEAIAATQPFKDQITRYRNILDSAKDDLARAAGKNNLAWQMAIWGACVQQKCPGMPDAEEEASNAVTLLQGLLERSEQDIKNELRLTLAQLLDTRAYIRLQKNNQNGALSDLEDAIAASGDASPEGQILFHYSVALKALNRPEATEYLRRSFKDDYYPSHELRHLWSYISAEGDYNKLLLDRVDRIAIQPDPAKACPD